MQQKKHPTSLAQGLPVQGTLLDSMRVIDAKRRIRTLPKDARQSDRFLRGIARKITAQRAAAQHRKKIQVPQTLPRHTIVHILKTVGFYQKTTTHFFHPEIGTVIVAVGVLARNINVKKNPPLRKAVELYLKRGNTI